MSGGIKKKIERKFFDIVYHKKVKRWLASLALILRKNMTTL